MLHLLKIKSHRAHHKIRIFVHITAIVFFVTPSISYSNTCSNYINRDQRRAEQIIGLYAQSESREMLDCVRWLRVGGLGGSCTYSSDAWTILVNQFGVPSSRSEALRNLCNACNCPTRSTLRDWAGQGRQAFMQNIKTYNQIASASISEDEERVIPASAIVYDEPSDSLGVEL